MREQLKNKANIPFLKRNPALSWEIIEDYLFCLFSTRNILRIFEELKAFNVPELTELVAEKIPTSLIDECLSKQVVLEGFLTVNPDIKINKIDRKYRIRKEKG